MATRSGQVTVVTAGMAVAGPATPEGNMWALRAHPSNTGATFVGDVDGDVSSANGFALAVGDPPLVVQATSLSELWFDAAVSGEKVCWLRLS